MQTISQFKSKYFRRENVFIQAVADMRGYAFTRFSQVGKIDFHFIRNSAGRTAFETMFGGQISRIPVIGGDGGDRVGMVRKAVQESGVIQGSFFVTGRRVFNFNAFNHNAILA
jgi:hypothetical protein